jgi:elongation factor Ts
VEIKASDVKKLREKTGAGMMDCKKALTEAEGDFKQAERILKELGLAAAAKRGGRATTEGRIFTKIGDGKAGILELSCETDFVGRNENFIRLGDEVLTEVLAKDLEPGDESLEAKVKDAISLIKENMAIRRFETLPVSDNELAVDYIHGEGGRIGVLVKLSSDKAEALSHDAVKQLAFDLALHVAAFNPAFLSEESVDPGYRREQEEIFTKQAQDLGKPENVTKGIVTGKMKKHLSEVTFLNQPFVKDDKRSVSRVLKDTGEEAGGSLAIADYRYYTVGEELEE